MSTVTSTKLSGSATAGPRHVAIIMDGNGRWAQRRGHARFFGHVRGAWQVRSIVEAAAESGLDALTLFAFSTENWNRPPEEVGLLWKLFKKFLRREVDRLDHAGVRLKVMGEVDRLTPDVQQAIFDTETRLASNTGLQLTLAVSYGSQKEIAHAAEQMARDCMAGALTPEQIRDRNVFERYLWTAHLRDRSAVDLVIRTSGEMRVSNFLLWQSAYAEYYFTPKCWPDFGKEEFLAALEQFSARERRYGGLVSSPDVHLP